MKIKQKLFEKLKREILDLESKRKKLLNVIFQTLPLIEGSYAETLVRCGNPNCHCEQAPAHPVTRLSHWEDKKLINQVIRVNDRDWVKPLSENYKSNKKALSDLSKLHENQKKAIKKIMAAKTIRYS